MYIRKSAEQNAVQPCKSNKNSCCYCIGNKRGQKQQKTKIAVNILFTGRNNNSAIPHIPVITANTICTFFRTSPAFTKLLSTYSYSLYSYAISFPPHVCQVCFNISAEFHLL